ncbi:MAG: hypothetical protein IT383_25515 [Deltaproteobacteria bacterium]|nr:hypothetical protein [Deltaproteobacteria bacterium]
MSAAHDAVGAARQAVRARARAVREGRPARRAALRGRRQAITALKDEVRARVSAHPAIEAARWRRRRRRAIAAALVALVLVLLSRCECQTPAPPPVPTPPPTPDLVTQAPPPAPIKPGKRPPTTARIDERPRADFDAANRAPPPWLVQLRLEVAARAPRLAQCFAGSEVPGALRWTASVDPGSGVVADSTLEGNTPAVVITARQRACLQAVLHDPPLTLAPASAEAGEALTTRVSLVVEF